MSQPAFLPEPSPMQGQRLVFLRSDNVTYFSVSPRHDIVPEFAADMAHPAHAIHITPGWKTYPITALCGRPFDPADYQHRRYWTPVMDVDNVCKDCMTALQRQDAEALVFGSAAFITNGQLVQRGDPPAARLRQMESALQHLATLFLEQEQRHAAAWRENFAALGFPVPPPIAALPAPPSPALGENGIFPFSDDDGEYDAWCVAHAHDGFVANGAGRSFTFHRADCQRLNPSFLQGTHTEGTHKKMGATDRQLLWIMLKDVFHAKVDRCSYCRPFADEPIAAEHAD